MEFKIFDKKVDIWVGDSKAVEEMTKAIDSIDFSISKIEEVSIYKNEISFIFYGQEPFTTKDELQIFYFDVKNASFNNGTGDITNDIKWLVLRDFYTEYAGAEDIFINAIDKNSLVDAMAIHKKRPDILPSISNSFYARWLVKTNNIKFLEWAKSIDNNIDFSEKNRFENPLKIAIGYKYEEVALWLLDNYPEISLKPKSSDPLQFIKEADKNGMKKLVEKMRQDKEIMDLIVKSDLPDLLPDSVQDIFVF